MTFRVALVPRHSAIFASTGCIVSASRRCQTCLVTARKIIADGLAGVRSGRAYSSRNALLTESDRGFSRYSMKVRLPVEIKDSTGIPG